MPRPNVEFKFVAQYFDEAGELVAEDDITILSNDWEFAYETAAAQAEAMLEEYSAETYNLS